MSPRRPQSLEEFLHDLDSESFDDGDIPLFDEKDLESIKIPRVAAPETLKNGKSRRRK